MLGNDPKQHWKAYALNHEAQVLYCDYTPPKLDFALDVQFPKTEIIVVVGDKKVVHRTHKRIDQVDAKHIAISAASRVYNAWNSLMFPFVSESYKAKLDSLRPYFHFKTDEEKPTTIWVEWSSVNRSDTRLYTYHYDEKTGHLKISCGYVLVNREVEIKTLHEEVKSAVELWAMHMSLVESYNPFMDTFLLPSRDAVPQFSDPQVYNSRMEMFMGMNHKREILSSTTDDLVVS